MGVHNQKLSTCRVHNQNTLEISTKLTGSDIKNTNKYMTEQKNRKIHGRGNLQKMFKLTTNQGKDAKHSPNQEHTNSSQIPFCPLD